MLYYLLSLPSETTAFLVPNADHAYISIEIRYAIKDLLPDRITIVASFSQLNPTKHQKIMRNWSLLAIPCTCNELYGRSNNFSTQSFALVALVQS